jgi:hypothetical protein
MSEYTAKVLVTYTIVASSEDEARQKLSDTEHPFLPHDGGWYEAEEISSVVLKENK